MSLHSYQVSKLIAEMDPPFSSLIMAAIRKADFENVAALKYTFPRIYAEFEERYNSPGGLLASERDK